MTKLGNQLSASDQRYALDAFVHRFTGQNKPAWAKVPKPDGTPYAVQFKDDAEWLANTRFEVTTHGALDARFNHCQSSPTWPNNPELRK